MSASLLLSLFKYKAWANLQTLSVLGQIDQSQHAAERATALRILNHTYVVDRIFAGHLQGRPHGYTAPGTAEIPTLAELTESIRVSDDGLIGYVGALTPQALAQSLDFTFTDGKPGRMTREEILAHLITHGGYHRGQVGQLLKTLSIAPPGDTLTGYLHQTQPHERRRS